MIDVGAGQPILIVPGIQGRWEWMRPAVEALSPAHRILTFSLDAVPVDSQCFERWDEYIDAQLEARGLARVTLVGVSFGGVVAARYAARRPDRINGLVLVSAPAREYQISPTQTRYLSRPVLSLPAFAIRAVVHLIPEVLASQPTWRTRASFLVKHLSRTLRYPANPRSMATWTKTWQTASSEPQNPGTSEPQNQKVPTLIVTGEPSLDRVVPVASTLEYLNAMPHARHVVLRRTGHLGIVSTPRAFARVVGEFVSELDLHGAGRSDRSAAG
jgi:pimeloyl-ACP methyl ester carboxylesterase